MELEIHANRMVLMKLRKRLEMSVRGHTLMKHKLDELVHLLQKESAAYENLHKELRESFHSLYRSFILGSGLLRGDYLDVFIAIPLLHTTLHISEQRLLNLHTPSFSIEVKMEEPPYSLMETNSDLDNAVIALKNIIPRLIELSEKQRRLELLQSEITITRRRVNALEYVLIPQLKERIRFIKLKLDENERADINRLMRIKAIIRKENKDGKTDR